MIVIPTSVVVAAGFVAGFVCGSTVGLNRPAPSTTFGGPPAPPPIPQTQPNRVRKRCHVGVLTAMVKDEYTGDKKPDTAEISQSPAAPKTGAYSQKEIQTVRISLRKVPPALTAAQTLPDFYEPPLLREIKARKAAK